MSYLQHEDNELVVLDVADDSVIADTVAPEIAELRALKRSTLLSRIVERSDPITQEVVNSFAFSSSKFFKLL